MVQWIVLIASNSGGRTGWYLNRNNWNDISFRDCSQSQFNYYDQVPHHGWDFGYADGTYAPHHGSVYRNADGTNVPRHSSEPTSVAYVPHYTSEPTNAHTYVPRHTSEPTISAVGPSHQPQPRPYCKICEVKLSSYKVMEAHISGKKHQTMLKLREETETERISNGQISNSQVDLAVQPKTREKNVSSEPTVAKHENYFRKDKRVTPEVPVEGKTRDNTSAHGHNFKRSIGGAKSGKYMKTNDGVRRPMESSKLDINSLSDSVEFPIQIHALAPQEAVTSHISNSKVDLAVQPKTALKSGENRCLEKNVNSAATMAKHKNYLQKDKGVTPNLPAEGKPRDNTSAQGHNFKHLIDGAKTGKYMMTNDGVRRPMESSKFNINSVSDSVESPIQIPALAPGLTSHTTMAPAPVVGSSFKFVYQHILALQTLVLEAKEYHDIQNPTVQTSDHPHAASYSNINTQPEVVSSDSAARVVIRPSKSRYCKICAVHIPPSCKFNALELHNKGKKHQRMLRHQGELKLREELETRAAKTGKHIKKNKVERRPMASSKLNISSHFKSVQSPVERSIPALAPLPALVASHTIAPTPVVKSSVEPQIQHVSLSQTLVAEGNEHYEIENPNVEVTDQPHAPENMSSDSTAIAMTSLEGFMTAQVFDPSQAVASSFEPQIQHVLQTCMLESKEHHEIQNPTLETNDQPPTTERSSSELQIQHVLHIETEPQLSEGTTDSESQDCTDEKNNQLPPSVVVEFNSPSCSRANAQTADGCSNHEQKMDIITHQSRTTQLSQVAVCLKCGDVGFRETLVFCKKCQQSSSSLDSDAGTSNVPRYCLDGPVIFTGDVTWFCNCEPEVVETYAKNASLNLANNASQDRIDSEKCIERVKKKQGPQNIAAKTMVLLSDNHNHGLSQCSNNTEKENKFGKECHPAPKDEANNSEGSMIVTVPHPIADPVWRGSLCYFSPSFRIVIGLIAHMSTLACSKVLEETRFFPAVLCPDLLPRSAVWPKSFMNCGPNEDSIALYFFPDTESVEKAFDNLVDHMMSSDLAIRAEVENADLLIFTSALLPIQCRRFQEKYYLWGVFRAKKKNSTQYKNDAVFEELLVGTNR
ncbi:unnamed protein product [Sphenostylis stenocarpa]|uniref:U1-type domain-containing protein n=1 Tax=Sphenostylis stenocarpa TaxID=92480 RepID=A0AA86SKI4_9FABA|nr:unnamed protein product [Sphenostylis stenocarpa]